MCAFGIECPDAVEQAWEDIKPELRDHFVESREIWLDISDGARDVARGYFVAERERWATLTRGAEKLSPFADGYLEGVGFYFVAGILTHSDEFDWSSPEAFLFSMSDVSEAGREEFWEDRLGVVDEARQTPGGKALYVGGLGIGIFSGFYGMKAITPKSIPGFRVVPSGVRYSGGGALAAEYGIRIAWEIVKTPTGIQVVGCIPKLWTQIKKYMKSCQL
jgi:hypothetical protein